QSGELQQAEALYRQIIAHDPKNAEALHLLGAIGLQMGFYGEAIELLREAIALKPNAAPYLSNMGLAQHKTAQPVNAEEYFKKALTLDPHYVDAYFNYGN